MKLFRKKPKEKKQSDFAVIGRIWRDHTRKFIWLLVGAMLLSFLIVGAESFAVTLLKPVFDKGFDAQGGRTVLAVLCAQIVSVYFAKGWLYYFQTVLMSYISTRTIQSIQHRVFSHLLTLDMGFFNRNSSGQILSRVINDTNAVNSIATNFITSTFKDAMTCMAMISVMVYYSWRMCLVMVFFVPIGSFLIKKITRKVRSTAHASAQSAAGFVDKVSESFQNVKIIKSYSMERYESSLLRRVLDNMFAIAMRLVKTQNLVSPIMESLSGAAIAGIIMFGGWLISTGSFTTGDFVTFLGAWISLYKPLKSLVNFRVQLQSATISANRVYEILDTRPQITDAPDAISLKHVRGDIEFRNVTFEYSRGRKVLSDVSLKIPHGKMVALVGESGGGKTTIVSLISRFYDASSGSVTIDGVDVRKLAQKSIREATSLVSQEVILFDDTVKNNIWYGKGDVQKEPVMKEVTAAAKSANADGFISEMPEGYDTRIGEKGVLLSGGQKQRLSIARAIIKDAPILLLDEATSALDTTSEREVQAALDNLMKGRTTVVIAHRLSTIVNADWIYVINKGRVAEEGAHADLLAKNGEYAKLYNMQFKKKAKGAES
ncbi:MAG: ATP-binding cassette domain-containing protein [Rickettsiales bacterium]|nr:ATP-binding cassette domain-containing protein [Rickettsiales bacterium]